MNPGRLLRWYPRAWRDQYGAEMLALIQDTLDEGRPAWRLRLGVVTGGLRERGHQVRRTVAAAMRPARPWWGGMFVAGLIIASLPGNLAQSPPTARGWQTTLAVDAMLAAIALTGAVVLANGLAAVPALVRFLRTDGWPAIRRRVWMAATATAVAGGALSGLILAEGPHPSPRLDDSLAYAAGAAAVALVMAVAMALWASVAAATARRLTLTPRVRAAQLVLGAVMPITAMAMVSTFCLWGWATQASAVSLVLALANLALMSVFAPWYIGRAARRGRRLRAAASPATPG
jgi:hypothetical protein